MSVIQLLFFATLMFGQESPCNNAVQEFKKKCGPFVGQHEVKMETLGNDPKTCPQRLKTARESEELFEKICVGAADEARAKCESSASGGITGSSGSTTMTEDLTDLSGTLKTLKDMFERNNRTGCEAATS